jgi:hypothetical protein
VAHLLSGCADCGTSVKKALNDGEPPSGAYDRVFEKAEARLRVGDAMVRFIRARSMHILGNL